MRELDELSSELVQWVEADARRLERRSLPVATTLDELVELERAASSRDIAVEVRAPKDLSVEADGRGFGRAIENLVRNAIRYARERVVVEASARDGGVEVRVDDDGPGIPEAERARVLHAFVRLDASRSRAGGRVGLGLAIAHRVVLRHGGTLTIETAPLGGARLITWWPASTAT